MMFGDTIDFIDPPIVPGVGPDAPTVVNDNGAKQSDTPYRVDLVPPKALLEVAKVMKTGAVKYGEWNWLGLSVDENLNHLLVHVLAYLAGDRSDNHISHIGARALMALEVALREKEKELMEAKAAEDARWRVGRLPY